MCELIIGKNVAVSVSTDMGQEVGIFLILCVHIDCNILIKVIDIAKYPFGNYLF